MYTMFGALACGLGVVPLYLLRKIDDNVQGICASIAAGVMAMASIELLREGWDAPVPSSSYLCSLGFILGILLVLSTDVFVESIGISIGDLKGADARRAIVVLSVMTLHSFAEGIGIGVSFSESTADHLGRFIAISIGLHNIPEGLAIGLTMVPKGTSIWKAALFSFFSSLPQPLLSVPAYILVEQFQIFLPIGLGLASGAMLWLVMSEIAPEALQNCSQKQFGCVFTASMATMYGLGFVLHHIQTS